MSLTDFVNLMREFGPFTAPLCVAQFAALGWMNKRMNASEERERKLRDKRVDDLRESTKMLDESRSVVREAMDRFERYLREFATEIRNHVRP